MRPQRQHHAKAVMTRQQSMVQLKVMLASATDEKLFALSVDTVVATHRIERREAEVVLLAAQETRRRSNRLREAQQEGIEQ